MLVDVDILTNHVVHHALHLAQLVVGDLLEVREVKTQGMRTDKGALLLHMVAQHLLQSIVEQVGSGMVGSRGIALVSIDTGHELRREINRQFLDNVYTLTILTLGIDNVDGLGLVAEHALVSDLSTHLAIERCVVEYQLVKLVLLLCHLAVTQDVAGVFGIVVADELLLA